METLSKTGRKTDLKSDIDKGLTDQENKWFEDFIATVRAHQIMLDTKTAPKKVADMYKVFFSGDQMELSIHSKRAADQIIVKKAILDYMQELGSTKKTHFPKKLSLDISDCHVLIWAEVTENDEQAEEKLILAEAKVNYKYKNFGIEISSTIIEDCDNIPVPMNYSTVIG